MINGFFQHSSRLFSVESLPTTSSLSDLTDTEFRKTMPKDGYLLTLNKTQTVQQIPVAKLKNQFNNSTGSTKIQTFKRFTKVWRYKAYLKLNVIAQKTLD